MARVMDTIYSLTGKTRLVKGRWGPRLEVCEDVDEWDTNTGYHEPTRQRWRKATNHDVWRLSTFYESTIEGVDLSSPLKKP